MKLFLAALCLVAVVVAETDLEKWEKFKKTHAKLYSNRLEDSNRYAVFQSNLRKIEEHNANYTAGEHTYYLGVTQFADMTHEEFKAMLRRSYGKGANISASSLFEEPLNANVPDSFDWRKKNAVTKIKDQGDCGGCWAFATVAVTESHYFLSKKKLVEFSEQQVLDCTQTRKYQQGGCDGGLEQIGLQYVVDSGIQTEKDYPFLEEDGECQYDKSKVYAQLKKVVQVPSLKPNTLKTVIATVGPTTVAVDADYLQLYSGGIYSDKRCQSDEDSLNHAMTNIGYGTQNGVDYWLIKNSWGTYFGENGYVKYKRGVNMCGIEADNYYGTF